MFKVFGAIGRLFRAILYTFAGDVSKWSEVWETSAGYIHAEYDDIEAEQKTDINQLTDAVAGLLDITRQKEERLTSLGNQIKDKQQKQVGARAKAEKRKQELLGQGKTVDQIKADATMQKCLDYFNSFSSDLKILENEASTLEKEIEGHHAKLAKYETRLQQAHKELQNIKTERHETVADIKLSQQEQKVNEAMLGISESKTGERRQRMQDLRRQNRAKADIQSRMAGIATEDAEQEFLEFAAQDEASSEFFDSLGLSEPQAKAEETPKQESESHIPE